MTDQATLDALEAAADAAAARRTSASTGHRDAKNSHAEHLADGTHERIASVHGDVLATGESVARALDAECEARRAQLVLALLDDFDALLAIADRASDMRQTIAPMGSETRARLTSTSTAGIIETLEQLAYALRYRWRVVDLPEAEAVAARVQS